jgi:hypothetical protein
VARRVAQVHHPRVQVIGQAFGGGGEAASVKLVEERVEPVASVAGAGGVIQGLPVRLSDPVAFALGELRWCTAHCWRSDAAQHCSTALIRPGAPSPTTNNGATARRPRNGPSTAASKVSCDLSI